jgi:hypothetical protein
MGNPYRFNNCHTMRVVESKSCFVKRCFAYVDLTDDISTFLRENFRKREVSVMYI